MKTNELNLRTECTDIVQSLMQMHECLQPDNVRFGVYRKPEAMAIAEDLIALINRSKTLCNAHLKEDFGK